MEPTVKAPLLYKVKYANTEGGVQAQYTYSYKDYLVNEWLKENTKGRYYHSPGYLTEKFIEFEDHEEATWFALHFA